MVSDLIAGPVRNVRNVDVVDHRFDDVGRRKQRREPADQQFLRLFGVLSGTVIAVAVFIATAAVAAFTAVVVAGVMMVVVVAEVVVDNLLRAHCWTKQKMSL